MNTIKLHDKEFAPYLSEEEIVQEIGRMAKEVHQHFKNKTPLIVAVLNGSFMFAAEFMKKYPGNCEITFVRFASYDGLHSTKNVKQLIGLTTSVKDRDVIILEDIVDTGNTIVELKQYFADKQTASLSIATLFFKPEAYTKDFKIDYIGLSIPNRFIVGFGLDYNELGRNLPKIYQLKIPKMTNIVLFGKPGAGKGTQAAFIKEQYSLIHISTGDLFRHHKQQNTPLGILAQSYMDKGELVPDEVTIKMLQEEMEKNPTAKGFILDGFPRTTAQAKALDEFLESKGMKIDATLALEADDEVLIARLLERGKSSGRADDQDESKIRTRFEEYNQKTAPLIAYYQKQGKFTAINGIGEISEITQRLSQAIDKL